MPDAVVRRDRASARSPRPAISPRPARPATCVSSWNVRSAARKSARPSPTSARDHADQRHARESRAPWRSSACRRARRARRAANRASSARDRAASPDRVAIDARRRARRETASRDLGLDPLGAEAELLEIRPGALAARLRQPASSSCSSGSARGRAALCTVSDTLQFGHSSVSPHCRQNTAVAKPRRLSSTIACSPPLEPLARCASRSGAAQDRRPGPRPRTPARMSTIVHRAPSADRARAARA